ncbi:hypothetical protein AJ78_01852 [Emergomyces pasteurianus Ep9510]|uniref:Uncharacterized protein n=1 Tax=Emergomyces pasteurianus Ep9510 TaxID=1447872 RepID=A0A1J9PNM4_9EURO|nr:hypothetical protein AJ78_01852 [Emergomyces pasteurianus Ep9510]
MSFRESNGPITSAIWGQHCKIASNPGPGWSAVGAIALTPSMLHCVPSSPDVLFLDKRKGQANLTKLPAPPAR